MIMYGRGEHSIAEQLGCSVDEARDIKNNVYDAFPRIKAFERESATMVKEKGYVTTLWGRKRRLPDYRLPTYEFYYCDEDGNIKENQKVPESDVHKYTQKLNDLFWKYRDNYIKELKEENNIIVVDNGSKIAAAGRQIINSRVQGCLAGNTIIKTQELGEINISEVVNRSDLHVWDGTTYTSCDILPSGKKQKCTITLENGYTITCSPDHKFKVKSNNTYIWKACKDLIEDDDILIEDELL
jgi:DNA polymerase I-like protein with 3'-5' exonuclease and polymerase domains